MLKNSCMRVSFSLLLGLFLTASLQAAELIQVKQGGLGRITIRPAGKVMSVNGVFKEQSIPFFKVDQETFVALIGIDMDQAIGSLPFLARWTANGQTVEKKFTIEVQSEKFGLQKLTLPKKKVDLDPPTLSRVRREQGKMKEAFRKSDPKKLWKGPFLAPVEGKRQGTFGRRRLINGQPRRSHTGEDISAPTGTPIIAPNHGKVVLVDDFFFNGRSVVIDHGLGLISMYFHLSSIDVVPGESVKPGQQIGRVGKSGRVTGPHLHWGMRLNNARIDPYALVNIKLD